MERERQLVSTANALPVASKDEARIMFETKAPALAHRLLQIAEERLWVNRPNVADMLPEDAVKLEESYRDIQDSGIEILSKFKRQLFTEKPTVSVNLHQKVGGISEDAQARIAKQLNPSREVVASATVVEQGDS